MSEKRGIGFAACASLVVANMIGTGVFTSLGFQLAEIPSRPAIMLLWLTGGVLALCGALCYAELSAALPRSGGEYHFLGRIFHPALGFMAGMISMVVGFAAPCALAAMAFGSYLQGVFPGISAPAASAAAVVIVTAFHLRSLGTSSVFQIFFTAIKIALVVFLSVALSREQQSGPGEAAPWAHYVFSAPFAVSLMYTLYAYSGWNAATYVLGEVRAPARVVPRALAAGTLLVTVLYLALNNAFLQAAPTAKLQGELNVAQVAAEAAFGSGGGKAVAAVISAGLVSALSAMVWAGPRVAMVLAEDHPRFFGVFRFRNASGIPAAAVVAQSGLTLLLMFTATFQQVLVYTQFALLACGFLTVLGLLFLRWREPSLERPFRVPLYPLPPVIFLAISAFTMVYTALSRPFEAACGGATMLAGLLLYFPACGNQFRTK